MRVALFYFVLQREIAFFKLVPLFGFGPLGEMEGHRHELEHIFTECFVVESHVQEEGLLVAQMVVRLDVIARVQRVRHFSQISFLRYFSLLLLRFCLPRALFLFCRSSSHSRLYVSNERPGSHSSLLSGETRAESSLRGALISQSHSGRRRGRPALVVVQILSGAVFFKQLDSGALVAHIAADGAGARAGGGGEQRGGGSGELIDHLIVLLKRAHHAL